MLQPELPEELLAAVGSAPAAAARRLPTGVGGGGISPLDSPFKTI